MGTVSRHIIGLLDASTRLVSTQHSFNIEVKTKKKDPDGDVSEIWVARYYYSDIQSAVRGYAKYKAKQLSKDTPKSQSVKDILELIVVLDQTINDVGTRLEEAWKTSKMYDPVEDACEE